MTDEVVEPKISQEEEEEADKEGMINIAFVGCGHGELNKIYNAIKQLKVKIDLLIVGGDFQAVRNMYDLNCMSVPQKYRQLGDFADYYAGTKTAPMTTIFIGGNHEASSYMRELFYGGWAARNIYYMGAANVINFKGVRIGGLSGIWNENHYRTGHFERLPYSYSSVRSAYHIRQYEIQKLSNITGKIDIVLSHDWPAGIEHYGDLKELLHKKKHFESDVERGELGSPPAMALLKQIRPRNWLSGHLHVKFPAIVKHDRQPEEKSPESTLKTRAETQNSKDETIADNQNKEEIELDIDTLGDDTMSTAPPTTETTDYVDASQSEHLLAFDTGKAFPETRFLAMDKCVRGRQFLQVVSIPGKKGANSNQGLTYDPEWLAITKAMAPYLVMDGRKLPDISKEAVDRDLAEAKKWVYENICQTGKLKIPFDFRKTAPVHKGMKYENFKQQPQEYKNKQTQTFCDLIRIPNAIWSASAVDRSSSSEDEKQRLEMT
ncbi:lariat debranching enzyme, C-terminal domain-containing protein [Lipomyces arxii]|uniref:lariat debranching enzyme, C-terminal domain-containing protein n=1 Tax=Lipomyces arxii TaxID=56418 RepID=UPI0034CE31A2